MSPTLPLILTLALLGAGGDNLVENAGFEGGLDGWKTQDYSGTIKVEVDTRVRKAGRASARVTKTGGMAADHFWAPVPAVAPGKKLAISAWVKGQGLQNCWLKLYVYDENDRSILEDCDVQMLRGSFDWKRIERTFTMPRNAARAEVRFCMFLAGEVWIDDVRATAPGVKSPRALDRRAKDWLDRNAVKVASLDFDAPLDDLAALKKTLKGVRIVQLGESSHGDGNTQRAKARLVRFLYEEMGFTVLAFESGLYECDRANALLREGKTREAMRASIFGIWHLKETLPLFEAMTRWAKTDEPLLLAGFDPQASGGLAEAFLDRLVEHLGAAGPVPEADRSAVAALDTALRGETYAPDREVRKEGIAAAHRLRGLLEKTREKLVEKHGEAEVAFFARALGDWLIREELRFRGTSEAGGRWAGFNLRDGRMGENLRWLANVRYPDRKIVAWAATVHQAHGLRGIEIGGNGSFYEGCRAAGEVVHEAFAKKVYTIGFCALGGVAGRFAPRGSLAKPAAGSVEDTLDRYGSPLLLVNLRRSGGPFDKKLPCAVLANDRTVRARWPKVLDGIFYIEEQTSTSHFGE